MRSLISVEHALVDLGEAGGLRDKVSRRLVKNQGADQSLALEYFMLAGSAHPLREVSAGAWAEREALSKDCLSLEGTLGVQRGCH